MLEELLKSRNLVLDSSMPGFPEQGQDCRIFRAADEQGNTFILRSPRNKGKIPLLTREVILLQNNAGIFPFSTPSAEWEMEVMIYPMLPGVPAITTTPEGNPLWQANAEAPAFLHSLAKVLVAIHNQTEFFSPPFSLRFPANREISPRQDFLNMIHFAGQRNACPASDLAQWRKWADDTQWPDTPAPIHGDMHAGNLLVNNLGIITGVLDWIRAGWGDAALDFIFHYLGFGQQGLSDLLDAYARAGGHVYEGMQEHIIGLWEAYPLRQAFFHCLENEQ